MQRMKNRKHHTFEHVDLIYKIFGVLLALAVIASIIMWLLSLMGVDVERFN